MLMLSTCKEVSVPTEVREEAVTPEARVVPVRVPAGAMTAFPEAAVINPLPLTVKVGIEVEDPKDPTLPLTVARVVAVEPSVSKVAVKSPVRVSPERRTVPEASRKVTVLSEVVGSVTTKKVSIVSAVAPSKTSPD